jgi:4-amino-4-deoxy-L-arabinose transferase-like glycosyltransferase
MPIQRVAYPMVAIGFAFLVLQAARSGYDHDEIQHLHAAWLVSQGQQPFRDFFEQRHPTNFYLLAPLTMAFEGSPHALVFAARILNLALLAALLAAFLAIVRPLLRDPRAVWPALVLLGCFFFVRNSMEVRPDPLMNVLCVFGLWQWNAYLRQGGIRRAVLSGLFFGAAFAILQKALAFIGLVAVGTMLSLWDPQVRERAARGAAALVGAAAAPVGLFALAIWRGGYWPDFVFWNYTFNRFYYLKTHFDGPSALATVALSVAEDPLLWIAGLIGLLLTARSVWRRQAQPELVIAATVVLGMLAGLFQSRWPFSHNLLLLQPPLALFAALAIDRLSSPSGRLVAETLLVVMVVKVAVMCTIYTEGHNAMAVQERILAGTKPSDPIAVPPPYHPIFRQDAFFFWYVPVNNSIAYLELCEEQPCPSDRVEQERQAWERRPPRFVFIPRDEPTWAPFEFDKHRAEYRPSDINGLWERID